MGYYILSFFLGSVLTFVILFLLGSHYQEKDRIIELRKKQQDYLNKKSKGREKKKQGIMIYHNHINTY